MYKKIISLTKLPDGQCQIYCGLGKPLDEKDNQYDVLVFVPGAKRGFSFAEFMEKLKGKAYRLGHTIIRPLANDVELGISREQLDFIEISPNDFVSLLE